MNSHQLKTLGPRVTESLGIEEFGERSMKLLCLALNWFYFFHYSFSSHSCCVLFVSDLEHV